jgi:hypothetical protein
MRHAMFLVPVALALTVSIASAESVIGIGMFGGVGIPSGDVTDLAKDTKTGLNMGFRFPMAFGKMFSLEPFLDRTEGKPDQPYVGTVDGMDMTSYGINLGLGRFVKNSGGLHLTPFAGIMNAKMRRENGPGKDEVAWQAGLSIGLHGSESTHWDIRGAYVSVPQILEEPGKRNYINISLGLTCVVAPR